MKWPFRVTRPLLDVVKALNRADAPIHGWYLADLTGQGGPNVYRALRRLQDAAWVDSRWEDSSEPGRPRRRVYWLAPAGRTSAKYLLREREATHSDSPSGRPR